MCIECAPKICWPFHGRNSLILNHPRCFLSRIKPPCLLLIKVPSLAYDSNSKWQSLIGLPYYPESLKKWFLDVSPLSWWSSSGRGSYWAFCSVIATSTTCGVVSSCWRSYRTVSFTTAANNGSESRSSNYRNHSVRSTLPCRRGRYIDSCTRDNSSSDSRVTVFPPN